MLAFPPICFVILCWSPSFPALELLIYNVSALVDNSQKSSPVLTCHSLSTFDVVSAQNRASGLFTQPVFLLRVYYVLGAGDTAVNTTDKSTWSLRVYILVGEADNRETPKWDTVVVWSLSCVPLFATPGTIARQAPLSIGFLRQEYWSGLPFPSPRHLPNPGIKPVSPAWQADSLLLSHLGSPR